MNANYSLAQPLSEALIASRLAIANEALVHYMARMSNYWQRSEAMQKRFPHPNDPQYGVHVDTEAILYIRELQECGICFPRWQDMVTVGGETDLRIFLSIGRACYESIVRYLPKMSRPIRILDFGVGCGRTARHFYRDLAYYEIHGCDVDEASVEYLRDKVQFIQPVLTSNSPPLPYDDGYFDAIYSVSVFTHLTKDAFKAWLQELARCLAPGGVALITLHGAHAFDVTLRKSDLSVMGINGDVFNKAAAAFARDGFIWTPQTTTSPDIDTTQYGISFIDRERFQEFSRSTLGMLTYNVGEIGNWQDLAVLRRKEA